MVFIFSVSLTAIVHRIPLAVVKFALVFRSGRNKIIYNLGRNKNVKITRALIDEQMHKIVICKQINSRKRNKCKLDFIVIMKGIY